MMTHRRVNDSKARPRGYSIRSAAGVALCLAEGARQQLFRFHHLGD